MSRTVRTVAIGALTACVVAGCGDATAPAPLTVRLEASPTQAPQFSQNGNGPLIACGVLLDATVTGSGRASWEGGVIRFYAGKDRLYFDSLLIEPAEVRELFHTDTINAGTSPSGQFTLLAGVPFVAKISLDYQLENANGARTAETEFTCGPTVAANAAKPTISNVALSPALTEVGLGETVNLTYTATSSTGLWATIIELTGACGMTMIKAEQLETNVTRSVPITLPEYCSLGNVEVTVTVVDASLQEAIGTTSFMLADRAPPTIVAFGSIAGDYFATETLTVTLGARDNNFLSDFAWEILPSGSSGAFSANGQKQYVVNVRVPILDGYTGPIQLRFQARDVSGLTSEMVSPAGVARVRPTVVRPIRALNIGSGIAGLAIDQPRNVVYLVTPTPSIAVLSLASMSITQTIPLPSRVADLDLTEGGDSLLVTFPELRAYGVIDLRSASPAVVSVPIPGLTAAADQKPQWIRVTLNHKAFVVNSASSTAGQKLLEIDLTTGAQRFREDAGSSGTVAGGFLERSRDRRILIFRAGDGFYQRYDAVTDAFGGRRSLPTTRRPSIDASGAHLALGLNIYSSAFDLERTVTTRPQTIEQPVVLSPDDAWLFVQHDKWGIVRSRISDGTIVDRTPSATQIERMAISDDGTFLITFGGNTVTWVDLR